MAKVSGNAILLKPGLSTTDAKNGRKVSFKLFDNTQVKGLKSQKTWSKKSGIEASCDSVILVDAGVEIPLDMAARILRTCSVFEGREMQKRFEQGWMVPLLG